MSIQLIAIDIDGTLNNDEHQISADNQAAIARAIAKGIHVVLTTGRPYLGLSPALDQLHLRKPGFWGISNNGALIHKAEDGAIIHETLIAPDDYATLADCANTHHIPFHAIANNEIYTTQKKISPYTVREAFLTNTPLNYIDEQAIDPTQSYSKVMICAEKAELDQFQSVIPETIKAQFNLYRSADYYIECLNKKASKGAAVHYVATQLGLSPDEVLVIGDQRNDLSMFDFATHKVAMGNGIDELKARASFITKSNNESGVAFALAHFSCV